MRTRRSTAYALVTAALLALPAAALGQAGAPAAAAPAAAVPALPLVYYSEASHLGRPFVKDPSVIRFHNTYFMYLSLPPKPSSAPGQSAEQSGWSIGIATSQDLVHWSTAGELTPVQAVEQQGIAAPGARVIGGKVHLFYQTYGHGVHDAICHAVSDDGIHFTHDPSNPVYHPTQMPWSSGRAIDAEVLAVPAQNKLYLYFATRDPTSKRQMLGMAEAPLNSNFSAGTWHDVSTAGPLLQPELPWEQECIEAPSVVEHAGVYYLFYAGAYNNVPQQIGLARSTDAIHWTRVANTPFLPNGPSGSWNSSESGHPGVLQDGDRTYLFYQGNSNRGYTYGVSMLPLQWSEGTPHLDLEDHKPAWK